MIKITHDWNSGNFSLSHSAEVTQEQLVTLASKGLLWHAQRNRKHDEVLGAFHTVDGKQKRKDKWKRNDVVFAGDMADRLADVYREFEIAEGEKLRIDTIVGEYTRETAALVYRDARNLLERKESDPKIADLQSWLAEFCGYTGPTHTEDESDYAQAALVAVNAEIKRRLAAL
jgi:hypothetical protein